MGTQGKELESVDYLEPLVSEICHHQTSLIQSVTVFIYTFSICQRILRLYVSFCLVENVHVQMICSPILNGYLC